MSIGKCVDYTLLRPDAAISDFENLCDEAKKHSDKIRAVCVPLDYQVISVCRDRLAGSDIIVCCVNDFPLGRGGEETKENQALLAAEAGVKELDTVMNVGAFLEGDYNTVLRELGLVSDIFSRALKVILETGYSWYTESLIKEATKLVAASGAFCIKTSTGFIENIPVEQKVKHVLWMHEAIPDLVKKVTGGLKEPKHAQYFLDIVPAEKLIFGASSKFWV